MKDATLATIGIEIERLREALDNGTLDTPAVVFLARGTKAYLAVQADSTQEAKH